MNTIADTLPTKRYKRRPRGARFRVGDVVRVPGSGCYVVSRHGRCSAGIGIYGQKLNGKLMRETWLGPETTATGAPLKVVREAWDTPISGTVRLAKIDRSYACHPRYGLESLPYLREDIQELGWDSESMTWMQRPEVVIGEFGLLSECLSAIRKHWTHRDTSVTTTDNVVKIKAVEGDGADDYADDHLRLYFDWGAYESYHLMFLIYRQNHGHAPYCFTDLPSVDLDTLPKLVKWVRSLERTRKRIVDSGGQKWCPEPSDYDPKRFEYLFSGSYGVPWRTLNEMNNT